MVFFHSGATGARTLVEGKVPPLLGSMPSRYSLSPQPLGYLGTCPPSPASSRDFTLLLIESSVSSVSWLGGFFA